MKILKGEIPMYDPNQQEEALMAALQDLNYSVWWNGYDIVTNATDNVYLLLQTLTNKGWRK
jgi:hypothetical protein